MDKTKEITVRVSDDVFGEIRTELVLKRACGNLFGILDEFCMRFVKAIENGETALDLVMKDDPVAKKPYKRRKK